MNNLDILKKLEGKKFRIGLDKINSISDLIADDLKIKIKSNQFLMIGTGDGSKKNTLDDIINTEFECISVMEHWTNLLKPPIRGFKFKLKDKDSLLIVIYSKAKIEVEELKL